MTTNLRIIDEHSDGSWGDGVAERIDLSGNEIRIRSSRRATCSSGVARLLLQVPERKKPIFVLGELQGSDQGDTLRVKMLHIWPAERRLLDAYLCETEALDAPLVVQNAYAHVPFTEAAAFAM